jgi:hypothetical protein
MERRKSLRKTQKPSNCVLDAAANFQFAKKRKKEKKQERKKEMDVAR